MSDSRLQQKKLAELLERLLNQGHRTFKDEYGTPHPGIETGLDEAFLVDSEKRDALLKADPRSEEVLKPYLTEEAISDWRAEEPDAWLIHLPTGSADIEDYPAIKAHLAPYKEQLEQRDTANKWYELLRCYSGNEEAAAKEKMFLHHTDGSPTYTHELKGGYSGGIGWMPLQDYFLLGSLSSKLYRLMLKKLMEEDEGAQTYKPEHYERLPFPLPSPETKGFVGSAADFFQSTIAERIGLREHVSREMARHFAEGVSPDQFSEKLLNWHFLNAAAISEEAERLFGKPIPQDMLPMWDDFLMEAKIQLSTMDTDLERAEGNLDQNVYAIFQLTEEEVELLNSL